MVIEAFTKLFYVRKRELRVKVLSIEVNQKDITMSESFNEFIRTVCETLKL